VFLWLLAATKSVFWALFCVFASFQEDSFGVAFFEGTSIYASADALLVCFWSNVFMVVCCL
jgi:hypothetical protein